MQQSDVSRCFIDMDVKKTTPDITALILFWLFCPQVEYKYDREILKGCVTPVVDDKLTLLALKNNEMNSYVSHLIFTCIVK